MPSFCWEDFGRQQQESITFGSRGHNHSGIELLNLTSIQQPFGFRQIGGSHMLPVFGLKRKEKSSLIATYHPVNCLHFTNSIGVSANVRVRPVGILSPFYQWMTNLNTRVMDLYSSWQLSAAGGLFNGIWDSERAVRDWRSFSSDWRLPNGAFGGRRQNERRGIISQRLPRVEPNCSPMIIPWDESFGY